MAAHLPARLTAAEGRRFGATVGGAFLVLALVLWWRNLLVASLVAAALATPFLAGALLVPRQLGPLQRAWMAMAMAISRVTTPVILGMVYYLVITPIALTLRVLGKDPLRPQGTGTSQWVVRPEAEQRRDLTRQF